MPRSSKRRTSNATISYEARVAQDLGCFSACVLCGWGSGIMMRSSEVHEVDYGKVCGRNVSVSPLAVRL